MWKDEKLAKEENKQQKIDKQENDLQRRLRIEAIKRANYILYEQTDKMKGLRSAQLYSDVLADREEQLEEKTVKSQWTDEAGGAYHEHLMKQLAESKKKDAEEVAARKAADMKNAGLQKVQLEDIRQRYISRLVQEKREGELVIEKSRQEVLEDAQKAAERSLQERMAAEEMALANQNLKKLRLELGKKEAEEDIKRQAQLRGKEEMAVARKRLEAERFMTKQATRQKMIDRATAELERAALKNTRIEEKQAQEARDREDAELAARAAKREKQRNAIELSRSQMVARREAEASREAAEEEERLERYAKKLEQMEREDFEKFELTQRKARNTRASVEAQISDKAAWRDAEREAGLREDAQTKALLGEDDARFRRIAQGVYEEAKGEGKNTIPIEKAMFAKSVTLLPATTSMRI
jgi:hypothetical protein